MRPTAYILSTYVAMFSDPLHKSCQPCPWGPNWPCPGGRLLPFTPGEIPKMAQVMPRLHLLRSSYDLFVYDFLYDFFGIVGGYKLQRMWLHCLRSPYDFFRRQTRTKLYRDLAGIVRHPQGYRTIIVLSSPPPYINRTMLVRLPCGSCKDSVR